MVISFIIKNFFIRVTKCINWPARNIYLYHSECPDEKLWDEHFNENWCVMKCHEWVKSMGLF